MPNIDPEREKERLSTWYAGMSDLELQKVGSNPGALTDGAFGAVREEMKKRNLEWPGRDMPRPSQMRISEPTEDPGNRPVVIRRFRDMPEAFVARSVLEDAGIACVLQDDNVLRMDWLWSNAMGGIKLVVRQKDAEESEQLLSAAPADTGEAEDISKDLP